METVQLTSGEQGDIYGTLAAAKQYIATKFGETYAAWRALDPDDDDRKRTLITAKAYIDSHVWSDEADTVAERDAITAFVDASYELAVMILADPSIIEAADQGSNIQSLGAGSASISFFHPTTKNADPLPPILMRLIGSYLGAASSGGPVGGSGQSGSSVNPFSKCKDLDRGEPY